MEADADPLAIALRDAFAQSHDPLVPRAMRVLHRSLRTFVKAKIVARWTEDDIVSAVRRIGLDARRSMRRIDDDIGLGMADGILQQAVLTARLRVRLAVGGAET